MQSRLFFSKQFAKLPPVIELRRSKSAMTASISVPLPLQTVSLFGRRSGENRGQSDRRVMAVAVSTPIIVYHENLW
jgi:hypothetical protein